MERSGPALIKEKSTKKSSKKYITWEAGEFVKLNNTINGKTLYEGCIIYFFKARSNTDYLKMVGITGDKNGGTLCDAREIYYDTGLCFHRMTSYIKNLKSVNERAINREAYQPARIYKMLLANTDSFLLVALIFSWILTNDKLDSLIHIKNITEARKAISDARFDQNLVRNNRGLRIAELHDADETKHKTMYTTINLETDLFEIERALGDMTEERIWLMFEAYQTELDKQHVGGLLHQEYNRRNARRPRVKQNAKNLHYTLSSILKDKPRLNRAIDVLMTRLDEPDPFVNIFKTENVGLTFYDRTLRAAYNVEPGLKNGKADVRFIDDDVLEGVKVFNKGRIVWHVWELYDELKKMPGLLFNQLMWKYVLSKESNDAISMEDMDALLYEATMPFYYRQNEYLLSRQFHLAYDFCFLLREQHRRFGNVLQYIQLMINLTPDMIKWRSKSVGTNNKRKPTEISKKSKKGGNDLVQSDGVHDQLMLNDDYKACAIEIPFSGIVLDVTSRFPFYRESSELLKRKLDDELVNVSIDLCLETKYAGISPLLYHLRDTLLKQQYLYQYVKEFVYPRFGEYLWQHVISLYKEANGLYDETPMFLLESDLTSLMEFLVPDKKTRLLLPPLSKKQFDSHFKLAFNRKQYLQHLEGDAGLGAIFNQIQDAVATLHSSEQDDNNIIRRIIKIVVEDLSITCEDNEGDRSRLPKEDTPRNQIEKTLLAYIVTRVMDEQIWSLCHSRILRQDLATNIKEVPSLCLDKEIIDMIESHPSCYVMRLNDDGDHEFEITMLRNIQCVSFIDSAKQSLHSLIGHISSLDYNGMQRWLFEMLQKRVDTNNSLRSSESYRDVYATSRVKTGLATDKHTIAHLKIKLAELNDDRLSNHFLMIMKEEDDRNTSYKIINDLITYDQNLLSETDNLFVIMLQRPLLPFVKRPEIPDVDYNNLKEPVIVFVETRRRIETVLNIDALDNATPDIDWSDEQSIKDYIYSHYSNCIECTVISFGESAKTIFVLREELDDQDSSICLYDSSTYIQCVQMIDRYNVHQREHVKVYDKKTNIRYKQTETMKNRNLSGYSKVAAKVREIQEKNEAASDANPTGPVLHAKQKKEISDLYLEMVNEKIRKNPQGKDANFWTERTYEDRLAIMDEAKKKYFGYMDVLREEQLAFNKNIEKFRGLLRTLQETPNQNAGVVAAFSEVLKAEEDKVISILYAQTISVLTTKKELFDYGALVMDQAIYMARFGDNGGVNIDMEDEAVLAASMYKAASEIINKIAFKDYAKKHRSIKIKLGEEPDLYGDVTGGPPSVNALVKRVEKEAEQERRIMERQSGIELEENDDMIVEDDNVIMEDAGKDDMEANELLRFFEANFDNEGAAEEILGTGNKTYDDGDGDEDIEIDPNHRAYQMY